MYKIILKHSAKKQLKKLDDQIQKIILNFLKNKLPNEEIIKKGKELKGNLKGLERWRIGNYRIIGKIYKEKILIYIIKIGHRREIYEEGF
jgi:mRNA interferase RelE/StbE